MKRVLFVIPPGLGDMAANHEGAAGMGALSPEKNVFAYPPQTVATCAAACAAAGWSCSVADGTGRPLGAFAREVVGVPADALAVMVAAGTADADLTFLRVLKHLSGTSPRPRVLLFGPSAGLAAATWQAEDVADAVLVGEPELAVPAALEQALAGATGRLTAADLARGSYAPGNLLTDLDAVPFAAWEQVPWQPYEMVSLLSSRGCAAGCAFCAYTLAQGNRFRAQSPGRTVAEWAHIAEAIAPPYLIVRDPVFAQERGRAAAICEGVAARGIKLGWACESRPEHFDRELIRLMKAAGCATIKIGMESGDPALLARIGRVQPAQAEGYLEQVGRVARWCQEAEVRCRIFLLVGLPAQSAASVDATAAALRRVAPWASIHPNVYRAYDGVALEGVSQPVTPDVLQALRSANRPAPRGLGGQVRRTLGKLKRTAAQAGGRPALPAEPRSPAPLPAPEALPPPEYPLAGSRVFLTGGSGFVGGHVARRLVTAGAEVCALVRPATPLGPLDGLPVEIVRGDLAYPSDWSDALRGCHFCFHIAALYAPPEQARTMTAVNVRATGALLAACAAAGVRRFVHTSTIGTVGRPAAPGELPDESTPFDLWEQGSHYVRSKRLGELIAGSWNGTGLDVVIVKPTAPVGAGDGSPDRRPTATGRRILAALQGGAFSYPAGGVNHAPVRGHRCRALAGGGARRGGRDVHPGSLRRQPGRGRLPAPGRAGRALERPAPAEAKPRRPDRRR